MNKKYYIFLILIFLLLFLLYAIWYNKYKQHKISEYNNIILGLNKEIEEWIKKAKYIILYKNTLAYKNKILKQDSGFKNIGERVVYITTEDRYNKFISKNPIFENKTQIEKEIEKETYKMTIYQKWMWFLFKKDLR